MTWTKIPDEYFEKTLIAGLSDSAVLTDLEAKCYCNRLLTDGRLPKALLTRATTRSKDPAADAAELIAAGLWEDLGDAYQIPWGDQRPRRVVEAEQTANKKRQQAYRERQALHNNNDHSLCDSRYCWALKARNGVTSDVTSGVDNAHPDPSVPTDPTAREGRRDKEGNAGADATRSAPLRSARSHDSAPDDWLGPQPFEVEWGEGWDDDDTGDEE